MPRQLKANFDGDLVLSEGVLSVIDGEESFAQSMARRLQTVRGAWRYDLTDGIPYFEEILGKKNPDLIAIAAIFKEALAETPGVKSVDSLEVIPVSRETGDYKVVAAVTGDRDAPYDISAPINIRLT